MRILIIDDERIFKSYEELGFDEPTQITYARDLLDAYHQLFAHGPWDQVFLDHDLGVRSNGTPAQVRDITNDIEKLAHDGTLLDVRVFFIHSMNPLGRKEMYEALHKFYNVTFVRVEDFL